MYALIKMCMNDGCSLHRTLIKAYGLEHQPLLFNN